MIFPRFPSSIESIWISSVANWQYRFTRDVLVDIADVVCSVDVVPYSEIKKIDERLQAFAPHPLVFSQNVMSSLGDDSAPKTTGWNSKEHESPMVTIFAKEEGKCSLPVLNLHG